MPPSAQSSSPPDWLIAQFDAAAATLREMILHPPGGTAAGQEFRRGRAAEQLRHVDRIVRQLKAGAARFVTEDLRRDYMTGLRSALRQANEAGIRPRATGQGNDLLTGSFSLIDRRSIEVLARDTFRTLAGAADSIGRTAGRMLRQTQQHALAERDINRILAGGIIAGEPIRTARALREELEAAVGGKFIEINGRSYGIRSYARTVVRTKTREAVETARHQRLVDLGIDLVMIVGKVSNTFCTAYLGQVYSLSGRHPRYPALASLQGGGPPFHPNCSKSTRAFVEELATEAQQAEAQPDGDVQKLIGLPPTQAQRAYKDLQLRTQSQQRNSRSAQSIGDSLYRIGTPDHRGGD